MDKYTKAQLISVAKDLKIEVKKSDTKKILVEKLNMLV